MSNFKFQNYLKGSSIKEFRHGWLYFALKLFITKGTILKKEKWIKEIYFSWYRDNKHKQCTWLWKRINIFSVKRF